MTVKMRTIGIIILMMIVVVKSDDDDIDPVIDMLLNGVGPEYTESDENDGNGKFSGTADTGSKLGGVRHASIERF